MSIPTRPKTPYISLDHPYTNEFYTNARLQVHLRRAGLLNKHGEILTQAEYDSLHKDIAIGRENKRKIDDAILEILNDLAREHWAHARDQMEILRKDLLNQFRRIENQYRRRIHPIVIRRKADGKFQMDPANTTIEDPINVTRRSFNGSTGSLPSILKNRDPERPKSVPPPDPVPLTELDNVREELNMIRVKLTDVEKKSDNDTDKARSHQDIDKIEQSIVNIQTKLIHIQEQQKKFDETLEQERQRASESSPSSKSVEVDPQQVEHCLEISDVIHSLTNRLVNLETSFKHLSKGLSQDDVNKTIQKSEEKTISRENVLETFIHTINLKLTQMQMQFDQLTTKFNNLPHALTSNEINQLIDNHMTNLEKNIEQNSELTRYTSNEVLNKIQLLEMRFNQINQTNKLETTTRTTTETLINEQESDMPLEYLTENASTTIEQHQENESLPIDINLLEERLTLIENYLRNTNDHRIEELEQQIIGNFGQIETINERIQDLNERKLEQSKMTQIIDDTERKLQEEIRKMSPPPATTTTATTTASQKVRHCTDTTIEQRLNKKINELRRTFEDNQRELKKFETNLTQLQHKFNEQTSTKTKSQPIAIADKVAAKDLQAIMPFIELLPTFDMFYETEWN